MNKFIVLKRTIRDLLGRESLRQLLYIYSSRFISAALGLGASVIVIRTLGAERYGLLTIAAVAMGIFSQILELGLTTTMIRKLSLHIARKDEESSVGIFRRIYSIRICAGACFAVAAYISAPILAVKMFHNELLVPTLRLAAFGSILYTMWYHCDGVLRSLERFKSIAYTMVLSQAVRTVLILLFASLSILTVDSAMILNISQIAVSFTIASFLIPARFYRAKVSRRYPIGELFSYSGWMYLFTLLFMLFDRLDVLMLGYFRAAAEVGIYSVAFRFIMPFELIPEVINTVFLPKVSKFTKKKEIMRYFANTLKITAFIAVLGIVLIFAARPLIILLFGEGYVESVRLFQILVGAFILLTMLNPLNLVGHTLNKPQLFVIMTGFNIILNFTGNMLFIPGYGALGAAVVTLVSRILGGILGLLLLRYYLGRWKEPVERSD